MYDAVRWTLLVLLFAGMAGTWFWSRRQAAGRTAPGKDLGPQFRILQKRWIDQKTGICLVEADEHQYLLAYTVGGSVSWQPLEKKVAAAFSDATLSPLKSEPLPYRNRTPKLRRRSRAKFSPVHEPEPEHVSR